jgi:hypothetical protein
MAEVKKTPTPKPVVEDAVAETVAEAVEEKVIVAPEPTKDVPTLGFNEDGVMGSTTTDAGKAKVEKKEVAESTTTKVALFSTRNVYAEGFGKINVGYNIVPKKYVDFWTAQRGIRVCTPEEVAEAFA